MDDTFKPSQRAIFKYDQGDGTVVCADPLIIEGKLATIALAGGKTINGLIVAANKVKLEDASELERMEAWGALEMLADTSRQAFELTPFEKATGTGADMAHALGVLNHFHKWCEKKNRKPASRPISIPPTESTSATPPTTATSSASP